MRGCFGRTKPLTSRANRIEKLINQSQEAVLKAPNCHYSQLLGLSVLGIKRKDFGLARLAKLERLLCSVNPSLLTFSWYFG